MAKIEIYTTITCGYCMMAKGLLKRKGAEYLEINLSQNPELRAEMLERAGGRYTVPQIFINGQSIGGFDDISALERQGKLDAMLKSA